MGRSTDEAGDLVAAYRDLDARLESLRTMLATPGDRFTEEREDRKGNDAAVVAAVDELRPLAKQAKQWLERAAGQVRRAERGADKTDDASVEAALAEVEALRRPARELADQAVAALDVGQRAALGRHLVTELGHADEYWGPHAEQQRSQVSSHQVSRPGTVVSYTPLDGFVDDQLERFRARFARLKAAGAEEGVLPEWQRRAIPHMRVRVTHSMKRRWRSLVQPLQAIEAYGREIDQAHQRLQDDHDEAVAQRLRAAHEAARQRRQAEQEAEARRRTEQAEQLMTQAADLVERYASRRGEWALSGRALRQLDWMGLYRQLCDGIRDADDVLVVAGIPRQRARAVLAWLHLAGEYGDEAGQRLGELLASEDELLTERARLHEAMAGLPVDVETTAKLAELQPELRPAYEWLTQHRDEVIPVLAAQAPEAARALDAALRHLQGSEPSS